MWRARGFEADEGYPRKMRRTREIPSRSALIQQFGPITFYVTTFWFGLTSYLRFISRLFACHGNLRNSCVSSIRSGASWLRFYPVPIARRAPGRVKRRRARASASRRPQPRTEHSSSASVSSRNADVHAEEPRLRTRRPAPPSSLPRDGTTQLQGKLRATGGERVSGRREPSCR